MLDVTNNLTMIVFSVVSTLALIIGFIAWFIRLESKVLYLEKNHEENKSAINEEIEKHKKETADSMRIFWTKLDSLQLTLNQVLQMTSELKGKIEVHK